MKLNSVAYTEFNIGVSLTNLHINNTPKIQTTNTRVLQKEWKRKERTGHVNTTKKWKRYVGMFQ